MQRIYLVVMGVVLAVQAGWTQAASPLTVSRDGWTVTADGQQEVLNISGEGLGVVLQQVRLNLRGEHGLERLKGWSVEKKGEQGLSIRTSAPRTMWEVELIPQAVRISTTIAEGVLTAEAPATADRIVARLLDPQGVPVTWTGTEAAKLYFGGCETRTPSFLPRRNPEVMYFALGQASGSTLHSLFDRKTDTAIDFVEHTMMQRSRRDADLLDLMIPVPGNTLVRVIPDYFTKTLGLPVYVPFDDSYFRRPPMVWGSWPSYFGGVREEDIVSNADWIADHLKPYGFEYVELDEGYDGGGKGRDWEGENHLWVGPWDPVTFPHGPHWLAQHIKSKGLRAGVWVVPYASAGPWQEHPDWYLHYKKDGKLILDYNTPTLDPTNPQVLDFVKKEFTTLDDWGFDYYKFDGEYEFLKYVPGLDLDKIHDPSADYMTVYRNRLKMIRETIGPKRFIEGCPCGIPLDGIGYFNSYFTGEDDYNSWQGMYALFSSINANAFLNHVVVYVMPGEGIDVSLPMSVEEAKRKRPPGVINRALERENPLQGFGTALPEARTLVSYLGLTGVAYAVASVMPELPEERLKLLKMTLPTMPILPIDLFSRGTDMPIYALFKSTTPDDYIHNYPEFLDLKVNAKSGIYDVVGLTNWRSWTTTRELSFADKIGLNAGFPYIAFDYWGQKLAGVFKNQMKVEIAPHDTRVFLIHPLLGRPQLVGTSRHITGAYSIQDLAWDGAQNRLRGTSETVPTDDYTLWFYVPEGFTIAQVRATSAGEGEIRTRSHVDGHSLRLSFPGQQNPVDWEVAFTGKSAE